MANKNTNYKYIDDDEHKKITEHHESSADSHVAGASESVTTTYEDAQSEANDEPSTPETSVTSSEITAPQQAPFNYPLGYVIPTYQGSKWDTEAQKVLDEYEGYTYEDYLQSQQYKQLEEQYSQAGKQSMQDTLGQVSARTGGLASTYATGAAQKSYDKFMRNLFEVANKMYNDERAEILNKYGIISKLAQQDYNRFGDTVSRYNDERNFAYKQQNDAQTLKYKQQSDARELAQKQVNSLIAAGEMPSKYLIDQAGYNLGYVEQMVEANKKTYTSPTLTPQQAYDIYDDANTALAQMGINVSGMLTYKDWLQVKNDVGGTWQPHYGVTQIGYDLARNSKTYAEYAENFVTFLNENHAASTRAATSSEDESGTISENAQLSTSETTSESDDNASKKHSFSDLYKLAKEMVKKADRVGLEEMIGDVESGEYGDFSKAQLQLLHSLLGSLNVHENQGE